jgi:hypothetical protein
MELGILAPGSVAVGVGGRQRSGAVRWLIQYWIENSMNSLTPEQIANIVEFGESEAWVSMYRCMPPEFVEEYGMHTQYLGSSGVTVATKLDWLFNRVLGIGVGDVATKAQLDAAIGIYRSAGIENYVIPISPLARPAQLTEWLSARGFVESGNWVKMYRGNQHPPSVQTDLRIGAIGIQDADVFGDIATRGFGVPPQLAPSFSSTVGKPGWHNYLGYDGEQPVATAGMFVRDDLAWLGMASTLESHRKRGAQSAMFARRIQDGLALGCSWFVTETWEGTPGSPNPSYRNMLRAGFELAYLRRNYFHQAPRS